MKVTTKLISSIYNMYFEFVYKTSKINIIEDNCDLNNSIIGFWHGDSCMNYLLFKEIRNRDINIDVIVTKDSRGDYIANMCNKNNINPLRIPDGLKIKSYLKEIINIANVVNRSLVITLDGPLGPRHKAKKLAFMLANKSNKDFVILNNNTKRKITLNNRWDKYIIPLPFNEITFYINNTGKVRRDFDISYYENLCLNKVGVLEG